MTAASGRATARETRGYAVLKDAHIPDARGRSQFHAAAGEGEAPTIIRLTSEDAKYWLLDDRLAHGAGIDARAACPNKPHITNPQRRISKATSAPVEAMTQVCPRPFIPCPKRSRE